MPKSRKATEGGALTGKLAMIAEAGKKVLKTDNWRVVLDPDSLKQSLPHLSTGSIVLDYLIGGIPNKYGVPPCPGLPRKRITQVWGAEACGKTTFALMTAAETIRKGGVVVYIDWENAIMPDYAETLGVPVTDQSKFMLASPDTLEDGVKLIKLAALGAADLIIIDSIGAAVPANIYNREVALAGEQARVGLSAKVWSEFLPELRGTIGKSGSVVLGISQTRAKIGGMGMGPTSEPQGGYAWKFFSDVRIEFRKFGTDKEKSTNALINKVDERVIGSTIKAKLVKCKVASSQGREEMFHIRQGSGIDNILSVIEIAIAYNVIKKSGGWFHWGEQKWQGSAQVRRFFTEDQTLFEDLLANVRPHLAAKTDDGPEADVDDDVDLMEQYTQSLTEGEESY